MLESDKYIYFLRHGRGESSFDDYGGRTGLQKMSLGL
jgi:hypothetical protein